MNFTFNFYRFVGDNGSRTTELVRDYTVADGIRGLVDRKDDVITLAMKKVTEWASSKGITVTPQEPFPSLKHPGKVWLEFRFGGLTL